MFAALPQSPAMEAPLAHGSFFQPDTELLGFLESLVLERFAPLFDADELDMESLPLMQSHDFEEMGIPRGPRLKIAAALRPHAQAAEAQPQQAASALARRDSGASSIVQAASLSLQGRRDSAASLLRGAAGAEAGVGAEGLGGFLAGGIPLGSPRLALSPELADHEPLLARCWHQLPEQRPTMAEAVRLLDGLHEPV